MPGLTAGGRRLEYAGHGPGPETAPTLVFLREGLGCVTTWRDFPARLAGATGLGALVAIPIARTPEAPIAGTEEICLAP